MATNYPTGITTQATVVWGGDGAQAVDVLVTPVGTAVMGAADAAAGRTAINADVAGAAAAAQAAAIAASAQRASNLSDLANAATARANLGIVPLTPTTLTDGATITVAAGTTRNWFVTLAGNRTLAFTGLVAGMSGAIIVTQDSSGSRTLAAPSGAKIPGGGGILLSTLPNSIDTVSYYYDGTTLFIASGPKAWA